MLTRNETPIAEFRTLSRDELIEEFFFTGLRQADGIDLAQARTRWGSATVGRWEPIITGLESRGWIKRQGEWIKLTARAYLVSNEVFQEFLGVREEAESA